MALRERVRSRARERLEALAGTALAPEEACYAAIEILRPAVGFERWCWPRTDPGSGLSTGGVAEFDLWPELPRIAVLEEHGDVTSKPRLVVGPRASVALSAATGGALHRSTRWRECLQPYGVGDELMTVCRDRHGCWGSVELMRDTGDRPFDGDDVELLDGLAPILGTLLRRSQAFAWRAGGADVQPLAPATLILDPALQPVSWTASFERWQAELSPGMLPPAVFELGARVRTPDEESTGLAPCVRIRTPAGRWATLEAAALEGEADGHVAVTIRESSPPEVFDLLCLAHDLTRRERQLVALVLDGLATKELASALCISPHTVQDHLKTIFSKTGLRTRGQLASRFSGRRSGLQSAVAAADT